MEDLEDMNLPVELQGLIQKGINIFPCNQDKQPLTKNGYKDASCHIGKIEDWYKRYPGCNWGMPTGKKNNRTVLDIDPRNGGHISIERFDLPETPYVKTGGGGWHYHLKYSEKAKNGSNIIAPGIDIKNDGGYVLVPPSKTVKEYIWNDEQLEFAEVPEWMWSEKYEKLTEKFQIPDGPIPEGQQDEILFRLVCSLKYKKMPPGIIREALKAIINDKDKCPQKKDNPFTEKDIERWIKSAFKYPETEKEEKKKPDAIIYLNPVSVLDFKKKDIPPIEWHIKGIIQKRGRTMISAKEGMGKSFVTLNMLSAVCCGEEKFLNKFEIQQDRPNALYIDFELGESALQHRLKSMGEKTTLKNLFVQSIYGWEILDESYQTALEQIIENNQIKILAFDPLGNLWSGDENKRMEVKKVTDYLDFIMDKFGTSILITHHWRKATQHFKDGGEMAAGSYGWTKWLDNHITLQGAPNKMVISCEKNRNAKKWDKIVASLDSETFLLEYSGDLENKVKFTDEDILGIFKSFGTLRVSQPEFIKKGEKVCSKSKLYELLSISRCLGVDKTKKPFEIYEKENKSEFLEEQMEWEE